MRDDTFIDSVVRHFNTTENATLRETAAYFGISKNSVYLYITKFRPNKESFEKLAKNKAERHIRGGQATKNKYLNMKMGC